MPLLLRGLGLPDNEIRAGVIDTLIATTDPDNKDNELVSKYASSLVTTMLKNAKAKDMPSSVCGIISCKRSNDQTHFTRTFELQL
jgi:DNA repair/transcription protein MET18/MMS19